MTSTFSESEVDDPITKTEDLKDDEEQQLIESEDKVIESVEEDFVNEAIELTLEEDSASSNVQEEGDNLFSQSNEVIEEAIEDELETVEASNEEITLSLEDELKDTIAADVVADLFENAPKKSLNDKVRDDIQIGLNDRIAFVKNLFGGSQEDFNRVVSQLNSFKTEKEAKKFINKMVKPDYNWADNEDIEQRFMSIVERKFL
jgi:hypothetical protein